MKPSVYLPHERTNDPHAIGCTGLRQRTQWPNSIAPTWLSQNTDKTVGATTTFKYDELQANIIDNRVYLILPKELRFV